MSETPLFWGDYSLKPHHFDFSDASRVIPQIKGKLGAPCSAVLIPGSGKFQASESAPLENFQHPAILVKSGGKKVEQGDRFRLLPFEQFKRYFLLEDGSHPITEYQVTLVTPKK